MKTLSIVIGVLIIGLGCHDVFHTLFHPGGRGTIDDVLSRRLWRVLRFFSKRWPRMLTLAGPVIFVCIISVWALLIVCGFALVYAPSIRTGFVLAPGIDPSRHGTFMDAFNVSLGALITLVGDINANSKLIRLLMGIEAVLGFGLLTASVSSLLSIYSVLEQRRSLAHKATLLHAAQQKTGTSIFEMSGGQVHVVLTEFTAEMVILRNNMIQFPVSYYFRDDETKTALPGILEYLRGMAERASKSKEPAIRISGVMLFGAILDYLKLISEDHLQLVGSDPQRVLRAYAEDHMREIVPYEG
jgi:hypothetical protein